MEKISQWMPRSFWRCMKISILFGLVLFVWLLFKPGPPDLFQMVDVLSLPLGLMTGVVISFSGRPRWWDLGELSFREVIHTSRFWTPAVFLIVCINHLAGQIITAGIMLAMKNPPRVSAADIFFLTSYPFTVIFFLLLPTRSSTLLSRTRVVLNTLIIMVTAVALIWYFVLGPIVLQDTADFLTRLVPSLYVIGDLVLFFCLIQIASRTVDARIRPGISLMVLATFLLVCNDSLIEYQLMKGTYAGGTMLDLCMPVSYLCYGLAVHAIRMGYARLEEVSRQQQQEAAASMQVSVIPSFWVVLFPYVLIPPMLMFAFYVALQGKMDLLAWGVYVGVFLLMVLVLIRQMALVRSVTRYATMTEQLNEQLGQANSRLEVLATTDPLTGLPNHRSLQAKLSYELERAERYQQTCSLLFMDLDHFKALNDGYGHAAGDEVLISFGRRLVQSLRTVDVAGRWGGEEFLAILPETTLQDAQEVAARICTAVNGETFAVGGGLSITCSIGIANYPIHATTLNDLVNAADQAMYAAKRLGRNQYRVIDDPAVQQLLAGEKNEGGREEVALRGLAAVLSSLLEQRDVALGEHSRSVAELAQQLAMQMDVSEQQANMIYLGGLLHDIGKIGVPDALLDKTTLTHDEWELMRDCAVVGARTIEHAPALRQLGPVIRASQEYWDGTGYPDQLRGESIPLAARVIAVADAYVAMTTSRRSVYSCEDALQELRARSTTQFDPAVVEALSTIIARQPELRPVQLIG